MLIEVWNISHWHNKYIHFHNQVQTSASLPHSAYFLFQWQMKCITGCIEMVKEYRLRSCGSPEGS